MPSFTVQLPNIKKDGPIVEILISPGSFASQAVAAEGQPLPLPVKANAMIDTGASGTVIRQGIAQQLGLQPIGVVSISTPSSTNVQCYEYPIRITFPNNVTYEGTAIEAPLQGQPIQCLIGRDILAHAILIYIGYSNLFSLSF